MRGRSGAQRDVIPAPHVQEYRLAALRPRQDRLVRGGRRGDGLKLLEQQRPNVLEVPRALPIAGEIGPGAAPQDVGVEREPVLALHVPRNAHR